jgi:lipoyl(octanoyl) transferase
MNRYVEAIKKGTQSEAWWLIEHDPVYTYGPRTDPEQVKDLLRRVCIPVIPTLRGGKLTYHGPGQRMIYGMIDLKMRKTSIQDYVSLVETWVITTLRALSVESYRVPPHTGIWTSKGKVASIGVHISSGITSYGVCLNMACDLTPFIYIQPCGLSSDHITSLKGLGFSFSWQEVDQALIRMCPF